MPLNFYFFNFCHIFIYWLSSSTSSINFSCTIIYVSINFCSMEAGITNLELTHKFSVLLSGFNFHAVQESLILLFLIFSIIFILIIFKIFLRTRTSHPKSILTYIFLQMLLFLKAKTGLEIMVLGRNVLPIASELG